MVVDGRVGSDRVIDFMSRLVKWKRQIYRPGSRAGDRLALGVGPIEGSSAPFLNIDSEVQLVPSLERRSVFGFEEYAANSRDSLHAKPRMVRIDAAILFRVGFTEQGSRHARGIAKGRIL